MNDSALSVGLKTGELSGRALARTKSRVVSSSPARVGYSPALSTKWN